MRVATLLITALAAAVSAAPVDPQLDVRAGLPDGVETMSEYFNLLATKVQANKLVAKAPTCDLAKPQLPNAPVPLEAPSKGLKLKHIALGRGTQNYTCDLSNSTAVPAAAGAVAVLFDVTCVEALWADVSALLPKVSMQFNLTAGDPNPRLGPAGATYAVSGQHYFTGPTTPYFNLDLGVQKLGHAYTAKHSATPAPPDAPRGQQGEPAVPWLKLTTKEGTTGDLREVYRVRTVGGSAPASCKGMPAAFQVQYAAQYWFYAGPQPPPVKSTP